MLKFIYLNKRKVPVPVPLKTLMDALAWVEDHLLRAEHTITRIHLDREEIDLQDIGEPRELRKSSVLELQIDTPLEISIQTLDALRNLCGILERSLKPMAVKCWQSQEKEAPVDFEAIASDLELIDDLLQHILPFLDSQTETSTLRSYQEQLHQAKIALAMAVESLDWKAAAKILLKSIEATLQSLNIECEMNQKLVFELQAERREISMEFLG